MKNTGKIPEIRQDEEPVDEREFEIETRDDDLINTKPLTPGFGLPSPPWYCSRIKGDSEQIVEVERSDESTKSKPDGPPKESNNTGPDMIEADMTGLENDLPITELMAHMVDKTDKEIKALHQGREEIKSEKWTIRMNKMKKLSERMTAKKLEEEVTELQHYGNRQGKYQL